jgi:hypothetical protein
LFGLVIATSVEAALIARLGGPLNHDADPDIT